MFKLLGVLIGLYTLFAAFKGEVYAKAAGAWGETISKQQSREYFWLVIAIYAGLSLALLTIF